MDKGFSAPSSSFHGRPGAMALRQLGFGPSIRWTALKSLDTGDALVSEYISLVLW